MSAPIKPQTITVRTRAEAAAVVPIILGFHPHESIVVIGVAQSSPTARIDLRDTSAARLRETCAPAIAAGHWSEGCIIAIFTAEDPDYADTLLSMIQAWLPGVSVLDAFRVTGGECFGAWEAIGDAVPAMDWDQGSVAASRDELVPAIETLNDPDGVLARAVEAWKQGNGAAAWIYLDRLTELVGGPAALPGQAQKLAALLRSAADPRVFEL